MAEWADARIGRRRTDPATFATRHVRFESLLYGTPNRLAGIGVWGSVPLPPGRPAANFGAGPPFPGLTAPEVTGLSKKIYVGNLPYDANADELREMFSAYGRVLSAVIATDRETGQSRGFAFVEMAEGTEEAIQALNRAQFGGRSLTVNEAKPREDRPRAANRSGNARPY